MATDRSSSAGVKSLRAMFENNNVANESPLRGKSPGGTPIQNGTEHPLSKVRTAFIEVGPAMKKANGKTGEAEDNERNEERQNDGKDSKPEVATTAPLNQESKQPVKTPSKVNSMSSAGFRSGTPKGVVHSRKESRTKHPQVKNPETPIQAGSLQSKSEKQSVQPAPEVLQKLANNLQTPSKQERKPDPPAEASLPRVEERKNEPKPSVENIVKSPEIETSSIARPSLSPSKTRPAQTNKKLQPFSKSPLPVRSRPLTSTALMESRQRALSSTTNVPTPSKGNIKESVARVSGTRSSTGFFKPRPKSPTRPINLPAHLVAPTASSAAKHGGPTSPLSPARSRAPSRRASNISMASRPSFGPPPGSRKASAIGPPPKIKTVHKGAVETRSISRAAPDEGFLARMMRPTTSSASKTIHGRGEVLTPPRETPKIAPIAKLSTFKPRTNLPSLTIKKRTVVTEEAPKQASDTAEKEEFVQPVDSPRQEEHIVPKTNAYTSTFVPQSHIQETPVNGLSTKKVEPVQKSTELISESSAEPVVPDIVEPIEEKFSTPKPKATSLMTLSSSIEKADERETTNEPSATTSVYDELD